MPERTEAGADPSPDAAARFGGPGAPESQPVTAAEWPPPAGPDDWHERWVDGARVRLREVPLWGRPVLVDEDSRVLCNGCGEFVPAVELGSPSNGHPVGLPRRDLGQLRDLPAAVDPADW